MTYRNKVNLPPNRDVHLKAVAWCVETYGARLATHRWDCLMGVAGQFRFRYKKDATFFALRWS